METQTENKPAQSPKGRQAGKVRKYGAEPEVWTERMMAALEEGVKGGKWFSLIDKVSNSATLELAWTKVRRNNGCAGLDGERIKTFEREVAGRLGYIGRRIRQGSYIPWIIKRVNIPKSDGKSRPLGIPTVEDRVVQQAIRLVIEPIFERDFAEHSYGFRPGRRAKTALEECRRY